MTQYRYPTLDEINAADRLTICRWYRHLHSPGRWARYVVNDDSATEKMNEIRKSEEALLGRIIERFEEFGGMTPEISKQIGW